MSLKTLLLALLVVMIWGSNFAVVKLAVGEIPPLAFLSLRFFLTGLILSVFVDWKSYRAQWKPLIIIGILMGVLHQGTMFTGLQYTEAGLMSILLQVQVVIVALIGWLFYKESIGWRTWTGIALGLTGVVILMTPSLTGAGDFRAYALGVLSALTLAMAYFKMKELPPITPANFIFGINAPIAGIVFLCSLWIEGDGWIQTLPTAPDWMILVPALAFQVFALSSSHAVWQRLLTHNPVSKIVPFCLLVPVFGVLSGLVLLGETLTLHVIIGGLVTVSGVGIITVRRLHKTDVKTNPQDLCD